MNLKSKVEKIARATGCDRPCWACQMDAESRRVFYGYLLERRVKLPRPGVTREEACDLCGRRVYYDLADWPPEAVEREQAYAVALRDGSMPEVEEALAALIEVSCAWGRRRYGEHYAGAIEAILEVVRLWFENHRLEISDEDLGKLVDGYVRRHAPEGLPLAP
jgi:hypothetical protein